MELNNKHINIVSLLVIMLLAVTSYTFITGMHREHTIQKNQLKEDVTLKIVTQYENLKSLIYWGTENQQVDMQVFSKHFNSASAKDMFGLTYLEKKSAEGIYDFDLTSLKPLNSKNSPTPLETEGLNFLENNKNATYYEKFSDNAYFFIGKLEVKPSCMKCHAHQGYKVGDIRGGISITTGLANYNRQLQLLDDEIVRETAIAIFILSVSIATIIYFMYIVRRKNRQISHFNREVSHLNTKLEKKVENRTKFLYDTIDQTVYTLINLVESRDTYTAGHSQRVHEYAMMIARSMQCDERTLNRIDKAAYLHDIGKIDTPDSVLLKPERLDTLEYELIKNHAHRGYEALKKINAYKNIANIVKWHHERYDGSGYPDGLQGDAIPLESMIIGVADTFDAMTTNRIYKARKSVAEALEEITGLSGIHFEPTVVEHALRVLNDVKQIDTSQLPSNMSEHHRMAYFYKDRLTGLFNKAYLYILLEYGLNGESFDCLNIISLKNFHRYNKERGWEEGNIVLQQFADYLQKRYAQSLIFRIFGDDFVVLNYTHFEISKADFDTLKLLEETNVSVHIEHFDLRETYDKQAIEKMLNSIL